MGCRIKGMTTQEYRASYDYRREYFRQNPGLFNCIWFCSQCGRPLFGRKMVVVDHIRPLNKGGLNHVSNCTACCAKCNSEKSDIVDARMYRGYVFKIFESLASKANKGVGAAAALGVGMTAGAVRGAVRGGAGVAKVATKVGAKGVKAGTRGLFGLLGLLIKLVFKCIGLAIKLVTLPLRVGSVPSRLMFLIIYTMLAMHFLDTNTQLLAAWG